MRIAGAMAAAILVLLVSDRLTARADAVVFHTDFAGGAGGWVSAQTVTIEDGAAWVTADSAGTMRFVSQYWLLPATPGHLYAFDASLYDNDPGVDELVVSMEFIDADGGFVLRTALLPVEADAPGFRLVQSGYEVAPPGTAYLSVVVTAMASGPGARFGVDDVTVTVSVPEEPPFVPEPPPPAPGPPTSASPARSPTPRPTATPRPAPNTLTEGLANGQFEGGFDGWEVSRGRAAPLAVLPGFGDSLVLTASGSTTAWVEQRVAGIDPGGWVEARAVLAPISGVTAAWVRIAWYASADATGAQIAYDDSPAVASPPPTAFAQAYEVVGTGPVLPPPEARSARVRILIRPAGSGGGAVAIDDVEFTSTEPLDEPPPAATPSATPVPSSTPAPAPRPTATNAPTVATPAGVVAIASAPGVVDVEAQRWLRISELMPDPIQPNRDADYEWVEIVNLGPQATTLEGIRIADQRASTALPAVVIGSGGVVVVAAPLAEVESDVRVSIIGNSLGNTGDVVTLIAADGTEVDRVVYGDAPASSGAPVAGAPGAGRSIERWFASDGVALGARTTSDPSPGRYRVPEAEPDARVPDDEAEDAPNDLASVAAGVTGGPGTAWIVLIAVGGGALGGAAVQRARELVRERRAEPPAEG